MVNVPSSLINLKTKGDDLDVDELKTGCIKQSFDQAIYFNLVKL